MSESELKRKIIFVYLSFSQTKIKYIKLKLIQLLHVFAEILYKVFVLYKLYSNNIFFLHQHLLINCNPFNPFTLVLFHDIQ